MAFGTRFAPTQPTEVLREWINTMTQEHRLTFLLSHSGQPWAQQLPQLLEPQGVKAVEANNVTDALSMIRREDFHAAVVDLGMPIAPGGKPFPQEGIDKQPGGIKLLNALNRLDPVPPAVVVRNKLFERRIDDRLLYEALKLNAFTVLDKPVNLEQVLKALHRILQRFYGGQMPNST